MFTLPHLLVITLFPLFPHYFDIVFRVSIFLWSNQSPFPPPSLSLFALLTPLCLLLLSFGLSLPLSIHVFSLDCLLHLYMYLFMFVVLSCSLWGRLCEGRNVKSLNSFGFYPFFFIYTLKPFRLISSLQQLILCSSFY